MKVENKTAMASSRAGTKGLMRKAGSEASLSLRPAAKRASGQPSSKRDAAVLNSYQQITGEFDPSLHHARHYNIQGYPIEIRMEKAGS